MSDTDFKAVPMQLEEARYSYRNSQQINSQTGLIGYLRADMGTNGNEFWSVWNDYRKDLKTDDFKSEFDDVINSFREKGQFLSDRQTLSRFCDDSQNALEFGERYGAGRDYGVRVNTQDYAYLMRLNPHKGEYNLYCYCYRKDWLDHHLERARRGIRFINPHYKELFRIPDGDHIRITYPDGSHKDRTCRYIDDSHVEVDNNLYHICEFAEIMANNGNTVVPMRTSLPDQCYTFVEGLNMIAIINKGELGYTDAKSANGRPIENRAMVDKLNAQLGVTKAQYAAMKQGSRFGFDKPDADPKYYDENGQAIKPKHKERER